MSYRDDLLARLDDIPSRYWLDDLVEEAARSRVSDVNNSGVKAQLDYLNELGYSDSDVLQLLERDNED